MTRTTSPGSNRTLGRGSTVLPNGTGKSVRVAVFAQGDNAEKAKEAGADIVLLECIPSDLGRAITEAVEVPVIGIGAGPATDGQILVLYDILDITQGRTPRFVKNYMESSASCADAVAQYVAAVKDGSYPAPEHCFN